jgi:plasmid rolling circle replication initiator protein Rep
MPKNNTKTQIASQVEKMTSRKEKKKLSTEHISKHIPEKTLLRISECADWFTQIADGELEKSKIYQANYCKNRFCPVCAYLKARKDAMQVYMLMRYVQAVHGLEFINLNLTAPNVTGNVLAEEVTKFNLAFKKLMKQETYVTPISKGYLRKLEITYNKEPTITYGMWHGDKEKHTKPMAEYFERRGLKIGDANPNYDTYHTHFHTVIAVDKLYFKKGYIGQDKWLKLWQEKMGDSNITQVWVEKVRNIGEGRAAMEMAKYVAKDSDMNLSQEIFDVFYLALKNRQLITYGGVFKEACDLYKKYLKKKGEEKLEDIFSSFVEPDTTDYVYEILNRWGYGKYVQEEKKILTEEQKKRISQL